MYSEEIIERFKNPKFIGEFKDADAIGEVGNVRCGDIMKLFLKIKDDVITDVKFQTYGCVAAIVSTDVLCEMIIGMNIKEAVKITNKDIIEKMGDVPVVKVHCSVLAQDALKKAIEQYEADRKENNKDDKAE